MNAIATAGGAPVLRAAAAGLLVLSPLTAGRAQTVDQLTPDSVAAEFEGALRGMAWRAAAQRIHPEGLAAFRARLDMLVEVNPEALLGGTFGGLELEEYRALTSEEVFVRSMEALADEMRGLVHAIVVRDVEIVGSVPEGPDIAHVVYRSQGRITGAQAEMRVMTLKRSPEGWKVVDSPELDVIREAVRGFNRVGGPPR